MYVSLAGHKTKSAALTSLIIRNKHSKTEMALRSLHRLCSIRSSIYSSFTLNRILNTSLSHQQSRNILTLSLFSPSRRLFYDCKPSLCMTIGSVRSFSADVAQYPDIKDPEVENVFKDFMAADWKELPDALISDAVNVLSKSTDDTDGKEALKNVFRAAEAVEEFTGTLETLKMAIDDAIGLSGENAKRAPDEFVIALRVVHDRYSQYLDSFGPDELYLKKKVETQLGTRMIHLKMRCSGVGAEWGKVSVLGTSGIAGSYVEQRRP